MDFMLKKIKFKKDAVCIYIRTKASDNQDATYAFFLFQFRKTSKSNKIHDEVEMGDI